MPRREFESSANDALLNVAVVLYSGVLKRLRGFRPDAFHDEFRMWRVAEVFRVSTLTNCKVLVVRQIDTWLQSVLKSDSCNRTDRMSKDGCGVGRRSIAELPEPSISGCDSP